MADQEDKLAHLQFVDERERLYFAQAHLGIEVHQFLGSNVGKLLHGRAIQEYEQAKEDLLKCNLGNWFGRRKAQKLQQQAAIADRFMRWCAEAIMDGHAAEQELEEYRG